MTRFHVITSIHIYCKELTDSYIYRKNCKFFEALDRKRKNWGTSISPTGSGLADKSTETRGIFLVDSEKYYAIIQLTNTDKSINGEEYILFRMYREKVVGENFREGSMEVAFEL